MIELLNHNKETYKRLCDVLENNNKCALVQATGTGKSYIAGKYIEEHTNTALILVPTNAISDAWGDLLRGTEKEVDIITYQAFAKEPRNYLDYDLVIADEMHHLGSDVWGKKFVETYLQSKSHKIIGLTATEIRYLDNSRDMTEEIFENIRVDGCDLPTAINTGVLPTFKYVSALYCDESDFDEWKEKTRKIKDIKTQIELKGRLDVCIKNMVSVKQAVNENLTDDYKKIIVFLNNVESKETALEMFKDVFPTANFYDVDYSKQRTANNEQISKFKEDSNRAVLFAVDMLNEGIHIKGTDCVIMFRKTVSPQVYLQQLGRGLASGTNKMPVIFDFVCNINSIAGKHNSDSDIEESNIIHKWNKGISKERQIIIKNYVSEIQDIISKIHNKTGRKFWTHEEDTFLRQNYKIMSVNEICKKLNRTRESVITRARILGISNRRNRVEWTREKEDFIKENYGIIGNKEMAAILDVTIASIAGKVRSMGIIKSKKWSKQEDDFLESNYGKIEIREIIKTLGRTKNSIQRRAMQIGVSKRNVIPYKEEEIEFVKNNYEKITNIEIAEKLGRTAKSVQHLANKIGILNRRAKWTKEEELFLKENYKNMTYEKIAKILNRKTSSVKTRAYELKLKKYPKTVL